MLQIPVLMKAHHHGIIMSPSIGLIWCFSSNRTSQEKKEFEMCVYLFYSLLICVQIIFCLQRLAFHEISAFPISVKLYSDGRYGIGGTVATKLLYIHSLVWHAWMGIHFYVIKHDWKADVKGDSARVASLVSLHL